MTCKQARDLKLGETPVHSASNSVADSLLGSGGELELLEDVPQKLLEEVLEMLSEPEESSSPMHVTGKDYEIREGFVSSGPEREMPGCKMTTSGGQMVSGWPRMEGTTRWP